MILSMKYFSVSSVGRIDIQNLNISNGYLFPIEIHSVWTIYHVNMMRCFQVIVLIYSSIYIQNRMAHWHSKNNISFIRRCCDLLFVTFLMEHLLYYMLSTMCCIYWSRRYISGLMMNILIMQTIRPIIAFYFIFLFMLIRHSSNETEMNTSRAFIKFTIEVSSKYLENLFFI